jgi:glycosyltransferase involved in cell wall biosynthesis
MNIILLYLGRRGSLPVYTCEMTHALLKRGCNMTCILSEYIENRSRFASLQKDYLNLELKFLKTYKTKPQFILRTLNVFNFFKLKQLVKEAKSDCIYIPMITLWSSILCFFVKNVKLVTTIHEVKIRKGDNPLFNIIFSYNIKKSDKIIVLSKSFIPLVRDFYNIDEEKICWLPHANYNYYVPGEKYEVKNIIHHKILFFGRITPYKGLDVLLKAMYLIKNINTKIILKIVGDGALSKTEKRLLTCLGSRVELINRWVSENEISKFFKDIDITILPYIEASQSGVIMLSSSFRKPVIATAVGGLPEQVRPDTGILIPPNDEKILAETILSLYKEPEKIFQMGSTAYNYATKELTWYNSAEKLIEFIKT